MHPINHSYKNSFLKMAFIAFFALLLINSGMAKSRDYYQIQVYNLTGKIQQAKVENFLKSAYIPALHRAGIKTVGVFKPIESDTTCEKRVYVWVPFTSPDHFAKIQEILLKDNEFKQKGADFLEAPFDQPPFIRKESILLMAFPLQPAFVVPSFTTPHEQRIYELRSYESPTEKLFRQKVKMFNEGGEIALFKKLEFNAAFYAEVLSGSTMPNLMYMTTFSDMASHDAHWSTFGKHPDWVKLKAVPEYLNTVSKAVKVLLHPTAYSEL